MRKFFNTEHAVVISPASIVFATVFLLGLFFLYYIRDIVITVFLALILMSALQPGVKWFEKKLHLPRILGIFILYIVIILVVVAAVSLIVPPLVAEVPNFIGSLHLPPLPQHIRNFNFTMTEINDFLSQMYNSFGTILTIVTSTFQGVLTLLTILVMTAYMLLDRDRLHHRAMWFSREPRHIALAAEFLDSLEVQLGGWVRAQLVLMFTIGLMAFIGLSLLSIPYALALALATGLLEILPSLGPAIAAIPAIILAYTLGSPAMAGVVLLFYLGIHQLENHIIVPRIMKANVDVSPLVTIISILIGFRVGGMIGAFLAVPAYILLRTIYSFWVRENPESSL